MSLPIAQLYEKAGQFVPLIEKVYNGSNAGISESKLLGDVLHFIAELKDQHIFVIHSLNLSRYSALLYSPSMTSPLLIG